MSEDNKAEHPKPEHQGASGWEVIFFLVLGGAVVALTIWLSGG